MAEKIYVGADHVGFNLKNRLVEELKKLGYEPIDVGPKKLDPADDYPDYAKPVAKAVSNGEVQRGTMPGVVISSLNAQIAEQLEAPDTRGALVTEMSRRSDAWDAGLRPGDVIVTFNARPIDDASQFQRMLADSKVGTTARVQVLRQGRKMDLSIPITRARRSR